MTLEERIKENIDKVVTLHLGTRVPDTLGGYREGSLAGKLLGIADDGEITLVSTSRTAHRINVMMYVNLSNVIAISIWPE